MENCKISEVEAERVQVKRVNNRPNAMATYGMAKMGPNETKDIFDKQFALVKEKHNLLVDKTADIYQEQERMSEQVSDHSERLNDIEDSVDSLYGASGSVVINGAAWSGAIASVKINGIGAHDMIIFSPATEADRALLNKYSIFIDPVVTDGIVKLTAKSVPAEDITLVYFIGRGA
jgi:hypothetical protein